MSDYVSLLKLSEEQAVGRYFVVRGCGKSLDGMDVKVSAFALGGALAEICVLRRNGTLIGTTTGTGVGCMGFESCSENNCFEYWTRNLVLIVAVSPCQIATVSQRSVR